ncbi:MAG: hypothetical protein CL933_20285 [Deltaproteobacteria bacterium]|nr:hypothetical protein [Deltaproteobacteria bacterium]
MEQTSKVLRPRGRPRSQASEDAILQATLDLLVSGGYNAVTVNRVSALARVSKGTIYSRWPTKENLVIAAFMTTPPATPPKKGPVQKRLVELLTQICQFMQETLVGKILPALVAGRQNNPELDDALAPLFVQKRLPLIEVIQCAIDNGEFKPGTDPEFVADLCMGPLELRAITMHLPVDDKYIKKVVESVSASLLTTQ